MNIGGGIALLLKTPYEHFVSFGFHMKPAPEEWQVLPTEASPRAKKGDLPRRLFIRAAVSANISLGTACKWLARFKAEDRAGLQDRSSRPRRSPSRTGDDGGPAVRPAHVCVDACTRSACAKVLLEEKKETTASFLQRAL